MVPLARHATRGGGVFDRISAGQCLWFRGRPEDSRHLVAALASADWSIPVNAAEHLDQDWRFQYIRLLWAWRPQRATDGLLHALLANPSDQFADWTAAKMAQERRYECAPIFMRYALWDDCEVCQEALHVMDEFFSAQRLVAHEAADGHKSIYPQSRPALAEILGKDAGDSIADWVSLIAIKVNEQSGPAPTVVRTETARLVELYLRWSSVATRIPANHPMRRLKLDVRTTDDLELEIEKWITQVTPLLGSTGGMAK